MSLFMRLLLILFLAAPAFSQTEHTVRRAPDSAAPAATVDDMAWLAGRWTGDGLGGRTEEIWAPPDAGTMMGMFRLIRNDQPSFYEFLTLRQTDRGLAMQLKHFHPDMKGWEEKDKFVEFLYVGREGESYRFEGLTFERTGPGTMTIYLALKQKDGTVREARFQMAREGRTD